MEDSSDKGSQSHKCTFIWVKVIVLICCDLHTLHHNIYRNHHLNDQVMGREGNHRCCFISSKPFVMAGVDSGLVKLYLCIIVKIIIIVLVIVIVIVISKKFHGSVSSSYLYFLFSFGKVAVICSPLSPRLLCSRSSSSWSWWWWPPWSTSSMSGATSSSKTTQWALDQKTLSERKDNKGEPSLLII